MLTYGNPPDPAACRDIGGVEIMTTLDASGDAGSEQHYEHVLHMYGKKLPINALIREALQRTRKEKRPFKATIHRIGNIYVGDDGWRLDR